MALRISRAYQTFVPVWEGNDKLEAAEQISLSYRRLTIEDMFTVQHATGFNLISGMNVDTDDQASLEKYWKMIKHILTVYTKDWKNVIVDGVSASTAESVIEVCQSSSMPFLSEIFNHVISDSMGTGTQQKNSEAVSEPESLGTASTATVASP